MRVKMSTLNKWIAVWAMVIGSAVGATGSPDALSPSLYYIFPCEGLQADAQTLSETAQAAGYAVVLFSDGNATTLRGTESTTQSVSSLLVESRVLVVDGERFVLHSVVAGVAYALRPAVGGAELVISPTQEIPVIDALAAVFSELQTLGILGLAIDLESVQSFPADSLKGPAVPVGIALDSVLYDLVVARDWFAYADAKGIVLFGLEIEVVAEKLAGAAFPAAFVPYIVSETDRLAKLVLPIDQLVPLAKESAIGYVRLPLQPVAP
jgi:hypothetical protein